MCIAMGGNLDAARRRANATGYLQVGPVGLGYLPIGGYLSDLRTLYCASWDIPKDRINKTSSYELYYSHACKFGILNTPKSIQGLGGFGPKDLLYGNYYQAGVARAGSAGNAWYVGSGAVGAQSSYNYRLHGVSAQMGSQGTTRKFPAHFSKPLVLTDTGCPLFKTTRLLGGRSYVADTFMRGHYDHVNLLPGYGVYHHKEGFNVLYGDGHAAWYGDPQRRIMWYQHGPMTDGRAPTTDGTFSYNSTRVGTAAGIDVDITVSGANGQTSGRSDIYHQFDLLAGMGEGNTPLPQ